MRKRAELPLADHDPVAPSAFTPEDLMAAVRRSRRLANVSVPPICVLDFDGDLTDWLVKTGRAAVFEPWACFHTVMYLLETEAIACGIVARTIGGPYAVLISEQLRAGGAELILALTSAGRVSPRLPLPSLVIPTSAVRDEGTSHHYLPPGEIVEAPTPIGSLLADELGRLDVPVLQGRVWTTDAPYRETQSLLSRHASRGVLAVEMQAASLFAFASARRANLGVVACVTNAVDHQEEQFDKGSDEAGFELLRAMVRAGKRFLARQKSESRPFV